MKKIMYTILKTALLLPLLAACSSETDSFLSETGTEGNAIVLQFSTGDVPLSRAIVPSEEGAEVAVEHLDVFIFEESGGKAHYERVGNCTDKEGTVTLAAKREDFTANTGYWVYLIANSTHATNDFEAITDLNSLKAMTQKDEDIFLTGITNITGAPQSFLMDGIAYEATATQEPAAAAPVVLYNGVKSDDTKLKVTLRRAAAKIIVRINKGNNVTFNNDLEVEGQKADPGYYLRNMPYTTSLLAGVDGEADLTTPGKMYNQYFAWTTEEITVTAYAYAHEWADASLEKEVRLVVNIPMKYTDESGKETSHVSSYYQIPISKDKVLKRNTCYQVTVTVNAPGALDPSEPEELTDIKYSVIPWEEIPVNIDGNERPIFLYVNEEEMEMHNITDDNTTLYFTSSSEVSTNITRVYYIDKFGQEQELEEIPNTDNEYGINEGSSYRPDWNNRCTIKITPDASMSGNIEVYSTLPENKTIRYIEMEVTNAEGITREVTVAQYPLEYITNIQGWYSYRDDFKRSDPNPTTYEYPGDRITGIALATSSITNWNGKYEYLVGTDGWFGGPPNGFFVSKVAKLRADGSGKSNLYTYYYTSRSYKVKESDYSEYNGRMYTIVLTSTSNEYTLGRPRMIQDKNYPDLMVTDPGKDNAQLVSPSFMIGSCVGEFHVGGGNLRLDGSDNSVRVAREHCAHYVEVYKDKDGNKVTLDDWRLPTQEELKIIFKFQGAENQDADAMDFRLNGQYYYCASGRISNDKYTVEGTGVACVRDCYNDKK